MKVAAPNPATLWATTVVDALVRAGLRELCAAPGSRSTPLVLAFAARAAGAGDLRIHRHLDERSAAFFALGLALESGRPAALLCTSGTAAANFFPAIVEARQAQVPLLVLTADRPPELRHSGANQTVDQIKLYGDQVLWSVDVALPEADPSPLMLRYLAATAARALAVAAGIPAGPVHLNFPFRKPLEPISPAAISAPAGHAAPQIARGRLLATDDQVAALGELIRRNPRGIVICGPRCPGDPFPEAVTALARRAGYPLLADPLSGLRWGPWAAASDGDDAEREPATAEGVGAREAAPTGQTAHESPLLSASPGAAPPAPVSPICGAYETFLAPLPLLPPPQVVLRFGALPVGKWLNAYLARSCASTGARTRCIHIHVRADGVWADDAYTTDHFLQVDETALCRSLLEVLPAPDSPSPWLGDALALEAATWRALRRALADVDADAAFVADLVERLPAQTVLLAGNSLPVRHLEQFGRPHGRRVRAFGNRGASGIDGNSSTALGLAAASGQPTVAVLGDITFYHDLPGLLALARQRLPVLLVVFNNDGGGIFHRLPVAAHEPPFTDLFVTPHGLTFEHAAALYELPYRRVRERHAFRAAVEEWLADPAPMVLEIPTDAVADEAARRRVVSLARQAAV